MPNVHVNFISFANNMSLYISSINSGSNGNCYYIGNQHEAVLIDAGLSCRETERRMQRLGLNITKIKAVFISHEHSDHIRGAEFISRKYKVPVYFSRQTYSSSRLKIDSDFLKYFSAYSPVQIGELTINAFPKSHDASEPHSFTVSSKDITIGILTDIGHACDHVKQNFSLCNAAFLEANYDEEMLEKGRYPIYLKNRIRSDHGHLSNIQALDIFRNHKPENMSHLLLSHLSQDNNNPRLVEKLFRAHAGGTHISVASRHQESPVYRITASINGSSKLDDAYRKSYVQSKLF